MLDTDSRQPLVEHSFRRHFDNAVGIPLRQLLIQSNAVLMAPKTAKRLDLEPGDEFEMAENISRLLPQGVILVPAALRTQAMSQMIEAFQVNLSAMSLLALIVGLYPAWKMAHVTPAALLRGE